MSECEKNMLECYHVITAFIPSYKLNILETFQITHEPPKIFYFNIYETLVEYHYMKCIRTYKQISYKYTIYFSIEINEIVRNPFEFITHHDCSKTAHF